MSTKYIYLLLHDKLPHNLASYSNSDLIFLLILLIGWEIPFLLLIGLSWAHSLGCIQLESQLGWMVLDNLIHMSSAGYRLGRSGFAPYDLSLAMG